MTDIEKLVSRARHSLKIMHDNKYWCETDEIIALLEAGAAPIEINHEQIGGETYSHMIRYDRIIFYNTTTEPVSELEKYSLQPNNP